MHEPDDVQDAPADAPTNSLGEVEPPIPDPDAGPKDGDLPVDQPGPEVDG